MPAVAGDSVSLHWSISPSSSANTTALGDGVLDDPCITSGIACIVSSTSTYSPQFELVPFALTTDGASYTFRVTAVESGASRATVWTDIQLPPVAPAPRGGVVRLVGESTGSALVTPFNVTTFGWSTSAAGRRALSQSSDSDFCYSLAYLPSSGAGTPATLVPFQNSTTGNVFNTSVYLPAGSWLLVVFVASSHGAVSSLADALASAQAVNVSVASSRQLAQAAAAASTFADAQQTGQALQIASGVAASISSGEGNADIVASIIHALNSTLSSAAGQQALSSSGSSSSSTLSLIASTLANVTANCLYLTNASRASALSSSLALASSTSAISSTSTAQSTLETISNAAVECPTASAPALGPAAGAAGSCPSATASSSTLVAAQNALNTLASTALSTLAVPGGVGINISSPLASVTVSLAYANPANTPVGTGPSLLYGTGVSSSFGPLPGDALSGLYRNATVGVVQTTSFFAPYCGGLLAASGLSRLEVVDPSSGAQVPIRNLSVPVSIALPSSSSASAWKHDVCAYWDPAMGVYATEGCLGLPSPLPFNVSATLNVSLYNASLSGSGAECTASDLSDSARLLRTLQFSGGSLLTGCTPTILDCPLLGSKGIVYLNPQAPASAPAVRCPPADGPSSASNCGCLAPSGSRALLVFTGATCALWQPGNGARCFWNATVQAFVGFGCVHADSSSISLSAQSSPTCLCTHLTDFSAFGTPSVPVASPDQMINISPQLALTKARVFLALILALFCAMHVHVAFVAMLDRRRRESTLRTIFSDDFGFAAEGRDGEVWTWRLHSTIDALGVQVGPAVLFAALCGLPLSRLHFALPEEMIDFDCDAAHVDAATSTALVFALLNVRLLIDAEELVHRQAQAADYFHKQLEHSSLIGFDARVTVFAEMFSSLSLSRPSMWLSVARLWRIILLRRKGSAQMGGGGWAPTPGLALVLYCMREENRDSLDVHPSDFFRVEQIKESVPQYLHELLRGRGDTAVRVWTTLLTSAVLSRISVSCLAPAGKHGEVSEHRTILDYADEWIEEMLLSALAVQPPRDDDALRADALLHVAEAELLHAAHHDAEEELRRWRREHNHRIARMRALATLQSNTFTSNRHRRTLGNIFVALHRRHEAAGTLLAPMSEGLTRTHRAALLITTLLGLLTTDTWFFWARSKSCCGQLRELLACPPATNAPCLGFTGDCADLQRQFADFFVGGLQCPSGPDSLRIGEWECTAFPDERSKRDNIIVALIAAAVSLPLRLVLSVLLRLSVEPEHHHTLLFFHPVAHNVMRGLRRNWLSWRWRKQMPSWLTRYLLRYEPQPLKFAIEWLARRAAGLLRLFRHDGGHPAGKHHVSKEIEEARHAAAQRSAAASLGVAFVYSIWAILMWFIVVYGIEIFSLQGGLSEHAFVKAWAITAGIEQATQLRAIFSVLTSGVLLHFLDVFWITPHHTWLEAWLDAKSVAATVAAGASLFRFLRAHIEHHAAVGFR